MSYGSPSWDISWLTRYTSSKILPTITGVLETIEPLTAIVLSYFFFSQKMNAFMLAGAAMVLVAVVILGFSKPREKAN